jgi:lipid-A-disaccharide synthase-like uncharacterized protein
MKWEPLVAMGALLLLGLWLVWGPGMMQRYEVRPGAHTAPVRIANSRGIIEAAPDPQHPGQLSFRILLRDGFASQPMAAREFRATFGETVYSAAIADRGSLESRLFRLLNITSWWSVAWIAVGLGGQVAFTGRTLIQWFISERRRQSVVPVVFWWLSLGGGVMLFAYFAWRQDVVGVLGQSAGVVIYARNLRLIAKQKRRAARQAVREAHPEPESQPVDPTAAGLS